MIKPIYWSELQKVKQREKRNELVKEALSVIYITLAILFMIVVGVSVGIK